VALPNFLIIGGQKCGTTWLGENLRQHPQVFMVMGTYFFDNPTNYAQGVRWYERFYEGVQDEIAICDKTPSYIWGEKFPENGDPEIVPRRAHELLPHAKIVAMLRNPMKRAISSFHHVIRSGKISPFVDINDALTGDRKGKVRGLGILERGLYFRQLERWLEYYPREQMRILILEHDVIKRPKETLCDMVKFLGIDPSIEFKSAHEKVHAKLPKTELILKYYVPMLRKAIRPFLKFLPQSEIVANPSTIAFLHDYYASENDKLSRYLGLDVSSWDASANTVKNADAQRLNDARIGDHPRPSKRFSVSKV
jgi:hypothetical protein